MAQKQLKRMNRFELLELMYELVKENEELRRQIERLEGRTDGAPERANTAYPPVHDVPGIWADDDEHYRTRREEVIQKMMEQTMVPPSKPKPAKPAGQTRQTGQSDAKRQTPAAKQNAQPQAPARQPEPRPSVKAPAQPRPQRPSAEEQTVKPKPQVQPSRAKPPAQQSQPGQQPKPRPKPEVTEEFDIDSILQDYLLEMEGERNGGRL